MESERLNSKGAARKHCTIVNKLSSPGYRLTILILSYIHTAIHQASEKMADGGSHISLFWSGSL